MKKYIFSLLVLLFIIGCALESKFALPNNEPINPNLIGTWFDGKNLNDEIIIQQNGEKKYKLILDDSTRVNAFSKKIKGFNIMNITEEHNGVFTNIFYGFEITNDTLVVSEVTDKLRKEDFGSQAELLNFFNENIEKEDFFLNPEIMIKK